ncbi:MAG TPA: hypothetical protein VIH99_11645 [Bdellovibrionota bacterium]|jgi:hypothetical protein
MRTKALFFILCLATFAPRSALAVEGNDLVKPLVNGARFVLWPTFEKCKYFFSGAIWHALPTMVGTYSDANGVDINKLCSTEGDCASALKSHAPFFRQISVFKAPKLWIPVDACLFNQGCPEPKKLEVLNKIASQEWKIDVEKQIATFANTRCLEKVRDMQTPLAYQREVVCGKLLDYSVDYSTPASSTKDSVNAKKIRMAINESLSAETVETMTCSYAVNCAGKYPEQYHKPEVLGRFCPDSQAKAVVAERPKPAKRKKRAK